MPVAYFKIDLTHGSEKCQSLKDMAGMNKVFASRMLAVSERRCAS